MLVGEDSLKPDDILRQRLDIVLRCIDDSEPLLQALKVLMVDFVCSLIVVLTRCDMPSRR
ncbi:hypothetical protein AJ87_04475 [Rhizobium yanglingense]|nr:hypothetical protein AJ87_04475 [Rhizobium yanglingense]